MNKLVRFIALGTIVMSLVFVSDPISTYAQVETVDASSLGIKDGNDLKGTITNILNIFLGLVSLIAVIFLIIGGLQYITAAGNSSQAEAAKKTIMYAIIGLVVIGLSAVIVNFVISTWA